ncbi:MAG: hypothetical protein Q8N99_02275 [Nanoarchaeota archaeon]|nr:hypothetical protein [Nanoarchaeota archaeon]
MVKNLITKTLRKLKKLSLEIIVDASAVTSLGNPVYSLIETQFLGFTDQESINAKLYGTAISYLGLGYIYARTMDLSQKLFGVKDKKSKSLKKLHDILYTGAFNFVLTSGIYYKSGKTDLKELGIIAGIATLIGFALGIPNRYILNVYHDLCGINTGNPDILKNPISIPKILMATGLTTASAAATYSYFCIRGSI